MIVQNEELDEVGVWPGVLMLPKDFNPGMI